MRKFTAVAIFVLIAVLNVSISIAQTSNTNLNWVSITSEGVFFYQSTANGNQIVGSLPSSFGVESFDGQAEWLMLGYKSFAISPDGQTIAFTARRGSSESALFLYALGSNTLSEHTIPSYWLLPVWSPNSEAILLKTAFPYFGTSPIPNHHVYHIATDTLTQITFDTQVNPTIEWAEDSSHLVYFGSCAPLNCGKTHNDLYLVSSDGINRQPLTDFATEAVQVCNLTWSPQNQRWYYEVGCLGRGDLPVDLLYSVDELGDNQLESDLSLVNPEEAFINYTDIVNIQALSSGIYVTIQTEFFSNDLSGRFWRVLQLTSGSPQVIYFPSETGTELDEAILTLNGQLLAVSDGTDLWIVNLTDGQITAHSSATNTILCDLRWLDNLNLIYNQGGTICRDAELSSPEQVWQINADTEITTNLTESLSGISWLLPVSNTSAGTPPILPSLTCNFSPTTVAALRTDIGTANGNRLTFSYNGSCPVTVPKVEPVKSRVFQ